MPKPKKYLPKQSEEQLQAECAGLLRFACPTVLFFHPMNGVFLGKSTGRWAYMAKMKILGVLNGIPDLCLLWTNNLGPQVGFIELKVGYNKLTDDQQIIKERLEDMGFKIGVAKTIEEFIALLQSFGVPMRKCIYGRHQL